MLFIQCKICYSNVGVKGFPIHLRMHGISKEDYIKENLDDFRKFGWQLCDVCGTLTKGPTCSRKCHGARLSRMYKGEKSVWYGKKHTEESKRKNALAHLGKPGLKGKNNPATRPEVKAKISAAQKANAQKPGYRNPMQGRTHTHESIKKIIQKRSNTSIERLVAKALDGAKIKYRQQFFLRHNNNKTYAYDFKIKNKPILIEVDGDYWHGGPGCKKHFYMVEQVKRNDAVKDEAAKTSNYLLIRVWGSEVKKDPDIVVERLTEAF